MTAKRFIITAYVIVMAFILSVAPGSFDSWTVPFLDRAPVDFVSENGTVTNPALFERYSNCPRSFTTPTGFPFRTNLYDFCSASPIPDILALVINMATILIALSLVGVFVKKFSWLEFRANRYVLRVKQASGNRIRLLVVLIVGLTASGLAYSYAESSIPPWQYEVPRLQESFPAETSSDIRINGLSGGCNMVYSYPSGFPFRVNNYDACGNSGYRWQAVLLNVAILAPVFFVVLICIAFGIRRIAYKFFAIDKV